MALLAVGLAASAGCATPPRPSASPSAEVAPGRQPSSGLTLNTPVDRICAYPGGKAVLDRDLPGLTSHPDFAMFKMLSLNALAEMANGKLTQAKLDQVRIDLARLPPPTTASAAR